jgi:hypothetical protein
MQSSSMVYSKHLWVTVDLRSANANLTPQQLDTLTESLYRELRSIKEVERVERIPDPDAPAGAMGGGMIAGTVAAMVKVADIRALSGYVVGKFASKPIDLEIEVSETSRKIKLTGVRPEDLDRVVAAAERLAKGQTAEHE